MPLLPSVEGNSGVLSSMFRFNRTLARAVVELHEIVLRGESPLSPLEREILGTFVSAVNRCDYSTKVHCSIIKEMGASDELCTAIGSYLADNVDELPVDPKLKPLLHYIRKLTLRPESLSIADANAVYAAGWEERALYDAIVVCSLYNLMNRLVLGLGLDPPTSLDPENIRTICYLGYRIILENL
ncbi:carboxymuconolactone decarboxylase [Galdieria sulphuraria]|uniref:Carboxymuconolactone decarboxylase n=1 Tax=Galdieria sulphuraria TaxID=130081 RepID=M2XIY6_GALSU|nr:carboxymuconolactone decarboxylase [Galdieria sulphuraria]EME30067.1 carboxymuconolactone decarboxylase [Galdieria sulphuraria]|eukprot:XP_005706587.1 carboxymuconolactone decarboxylase [Galdieria sulphuraria]